MCHIPVRPILLRFSNKTGVGTPKISFWHDSFHAVVIVTNKITLVKVVSGHNLSDAFLYFGECENFLHSNGIMNLAPFHLILGRVNQVKRTRL